ncbi:hypothetical protein EV421DRAFT_1808605 [Armillaria borealis]|uniref:Uncharacterized protein n=1 Tax=Armillaria borealis TaxID=47425 RepID=A0AA39MPY9_9AGAR|nr:hypothetical protein EV421DRAFT_1808605 [Armillaria borealis]
MVRLVVVWINAPIESLAHLVPSMSRPLSLVCNSTKLPWIRPPKDEANHHCEYATGDAKATALQWLQTLAKPALITSS